MDESFITNKVFPDFVIIVRPAVTIAHNWSQNVTFPLVFYPPLCPLKIHPRNAAEVLTSKKGKKTNLLPQNHIRQVFIDPSLCTEAGKGSTLRMSVLKTAQCRLLLGNYIPCECITNFRGKGKKKLNKMNWNLLFNLFKFQSSVGWLNACLWFILVLPLPSITSSPPLPPKLS